MATGHGEPCSSRSPVVPGRARPTGPRCVEPTTTSDASCSVASAWSARAGETAATAWRGASPASTPASSASLSAWSACRKDSFEARLGVASYGYALARRNRAPVTCASCVANATASCAPALLSMPTRISDMRSRLLLIVESRPSSAARRRRPTGQDRRRSRDLRRPVAGNYGARPPGVRHPSPMTDDSPDPSEITVVLADDHAVVRKGLRLLVDAEDGLRVVAEAGNVPDALRMA